MVPARKRSTQHVTLQEVQHLFDEWRREKKGRDPIPSALWKAAASLAAQYSINQIARALRLSHQDLKHHIHPPVPLHPSPAFVELMTLTTDECTIEIEKPTGERMRIRGFCNVTELARVFLA